MQSSASTWLALPISSEISNRHGKNGASLVPCSRRLQPQLSTISVTSSTEGAIVKPGNGGSATSSRLRISNAKSVICQTCIHDIACSMAGMFWHDSESCNNRCLLLRSRCILRPLGSPNRSKLLLWSAKITLLVYCMPYGSNGSLASTGLMTHGYANSPFDEASVSSVRLNRHASCHTCWGSGRS